MPLSITMPNLKFTERSTDKCVLRGYRQSNVRRLLPVSDYCRALFRFLNCAQQFDFRCKILRGEILGTTFREPRDNLLSSSAYSGISVYRFFYICIPPEFSESLCVWKTPYMITTTRSQNKRLDQV